MDTIITLLIVGCAALWALARVIRKFRPVASGAPSCGSCSGCGPEPKPCPSRGVVVLLMMLGGVAAGSVHADEAESARPAETSEEAVEDGESATRPALLDRLAMVDDALESVSGIDISGFFDVSVARGDGGTEAGLGALEIDLARDFGRHTQAAAAVVFTEDGGAGLAVAYVDVHFFGKLLAPRGRLPVEKGFHLQMGRFDVPFGADWQYFASQDRVEISAPLTTDVLLGGGRNDSGIRILGGGRSANYSAFALRSGSDGFQYGARAGFTPFDNPYQFSPSRRFEAGLSLLEDVDRSGGLRERAAAVDLSATLRALELRAEYARTTAAGEGSARSSGWHVTAAVDAGSLFGVPLRPFVRYDVIRGDGMSGKRGDRLTGGVNATLLQSLLLKIELQHLPGGGTSPLAAHGYRDGALAAQAVVRF